LIFDEMAINSSHGGHAMTTTDRDHEKEGPSPIVQHLNDASTSDIDADDLPKGYFTRPAFIGTMVAAGLALAGVGILSLSLSLSTPTITALTWLLEQGGGTFALVAPLLGIINNDIGPDPNYLWIALVYTLTLAIGQVLVGRLSDVTNLFLCCIF
jgi:hypothetical protein